MSETLRQAFSNFIAEFRYRWYVVAVDFFMLTAAWFGAFWVWSNFGIISVIMWDLAIKYFLPVVLSQSLILIGFRVHRSLWKFISTQDLMRLFAALVMGSMAAGFVVFQFDRLQFLPRGIFAVNLILATIVTIGSRVLYRLVMDRQWRRDFSKKALIVGAGASGENAVRNLLRSEPSVYKPIGFVDDDLKKAGQIIHGVKVIGNTQIIPEIVKRNDVDLILLAVHKATSSDIQRIVESCEKSKAEFRILPRFDDMVDGRHEGINFRKLKLEDLLGRDPVSMVLDELRDQYASKTVLVTGAGGSIGSELCRQIARYQPNQIILLDHSEFNLYRIDMELGEEFPGIRRHVVLGDICDNALLTEVFNQYRPELVFHAAAYKHVPLLEQQVSAGIRNNIIGTRSVADMANKFSAEKFVLISTDKAVNPSSLMGATKRIAEMYCQRLNEKGLTRFVTVRFGNVLGSAGSVVPRFQHQIEKGGPVTVTHPDMERYFMTIAEACQLILTAGKSGLGGEIFVLDMGRPIKILFLAEQMIRMAGLEPGQDIKVNFTGIRDGEKLTEVLFHEEEISRDTGHSKLFLANGREVSGNMAASIHKLQRALDDRDDYQALSIVAHLVPEVLSDSRVFGYLGEPLPPLQEQTSQLVGQAAS